MKKKRYSSFFFDPTRAWVINLVVTLVTIAGAIAIFVVYVLTSNDLAPDSLAGYVYGIIGTFFLILAWIHYTGQRRSRKRMVGKLNVALHWHISFAVIALVLLMLHSFGNFNPRSGTYTLYGLIALIISGVIGRLLDRLLPRLIAREASLAMTEQGEDRIAEIMQSMQARVRSKSQPLHPLTLHQTSGRHTQPVQRVEIKSGQRALPSARGEAYVPLTEGSTMGRPPVIPPSQPATLNGDLQLSMGDLKVVQQALYREQFYRAIIRYWRVFHVCLALLTVCLLIWHIVYAMQLLAPTMIGR